MNQVKSRLQSLGLLDRALAAASDEELQAAYDSLGDDHRDAVDELATADDADADGPVTRLREAAAKGRINGSLESIALVLTDACLADCIEQLGDRADHPSSDDLREVLPGIVERHGLGITRLMLASTVAGEAPAAAIIRDLLKNDDLVKLPPAPQRTPTPLVRAPEVDPDERAAIKAKRQELKRKKQEAARQRREQAQQAKRKR